MRWRLVFSFLAVVIVAIASVILVVRLDNETQVQTYFFRGGISGADGLVSALEEFYNQHQGWLGIESQFAMMRAGGGLGTGRRTGSGGMMASGWVRLADAKGNVLVDTSGGTTVKVLSSSELNTGIQLKDSSNRLVGFLVVEGSSSAQRGDELPLVTKLNEAALRAGLISLLAALVLALILATGFIRPVRRLTSAAQQLASGDLSHRVEVKGTDELAELARSFNVMADSLQQSEQRRREMTADIAHELRSPLAVQRAHLEAFQDGIYLLNVANLQPILEQSRLLERLVEDLRTIALADAGELHLEMVKVDLRDLLEGILERFKPTAETREIALSLLVGEDPCPKVQADPDRLAQVMNNLVSNALRYAPQGGMVQLCLDWQNGSAQVHVHDNGMGIPEEALPHIFERFYRADHARSRDRGGSGLGLAIARHLALAHGGDLTAANAPEGGATFTLTLPVGA